MRPGYDRSVNGLVGALVAVLLLILVMFGLTRFAQRDQPEPAPTVDYADTLVQARREAPFDVLAPTPVPPDWRATSASAERRGDEYDWHLGFLVDDTEYAAVDQSTDSGQDFIEQVTPATDRGEPVDVDGTAWQSFSDPGSDDQALVLRGQESTTVVSGTVDVDVLVGLAGSLRS